MAIEAEYTEENFNKYGADYEWAVIFDAAGLGDLEDPDGEFDTQALEDWLTAALVSRGMNESSARSKVREIGGANSKDREPS